MLPLNACCLHHPALLGKFLAKKEKLAVKVLSLCILVNNGSYDGVVLVAKTLDQQQQDLEAFLEGGDVAST